MGIKDILKRKDIQGRDVPGRDLEDVTDDVMAPSSSVEDRVVSRPDGNEHEPKVPEKTPIVSINGKDIDEEERAA